MSKLFVVALCSCIVIGASEHRPAPIVDPTFFDDVPYTSPKAGDSGHKLDQMIFIEIEEISLNELVRDRDLLKSMRTDIDAKNRELYELKLEHELFKRVNPYNPRVLVSVTAVTTFILTSLFYRWKS